MLDRLEIMFFTTELPRALFLNAVFHKRAFVGYMGDVHALNQKVADDLMSGEMENKVAHVFMED